MTTRHKTNFFNCCAIIPTYNHYRRLDSIVEVFGKKQIPVILINDGSNEPTRHECEKIANHHSHVTMIHRETNCGKGAAMVIGFLTAIKKNYSHALQVDADGQHDLTDIVQFIEAARNNPDDMIIGLPIFNESVPKSRFYGRKVTNFWVSIECLSKDIKDAMFGYRCYPLNAIKELLSNQKLTQGMDFDIEILVRLFWQGIKTISILSKVSYEGHEDSNFRLFIDNVKISVLHTRLVLESFYRLPALWLKK